MKNRYRVCLNQYLKATVASLNILLRSSSISVPEKIQSLATIAKRQLTLTRTQEEKSSTGSLMFIINSNCSLRLFILSFSSWTNILHKEMCKRANSNL